MNVGLISFPRRPVSLLLISTEAVLENLTEYIFILTCIGTDPKSHWEESHWFYSCSDHASKTVQVINRITDLVQDSQKS